jgi:hypothetical protein
MSMMSLSLRLRPSSKIDNIDHSSRIDADKTDDIDCSIYQCDIYSYGTRDDVDRSDIGFHKRDP